MQAVSADSMVPEPNLENLGIPGGLRRNPPNTGALEKFAQDMAENLIQSFLSQMEMEEAVASSSNQGQEALAEELAAAVIEIALREACAGCNVEGFHSLKSAGIKMDDEQTEKLEFLDESGRERVFLNVDTETDPTKELQTSKDFQLHHPPLCHSGLPVMGSLDYPDAPPTTPLLPELERSRSSFARKLKGGLAKVFLPSPPPPTPKEKEDDVGTVNNPRVELMEHLMHSLSTDDLARENFEVGANMEAFAEALSCNIMDWVLSARSREQIPDDNDLHRPAQLPETIITSSLGEAETPLV